LKHQRFILLDTQWLTSHLLQFGAIEVSRAKYLELLERALGLKRSFL
jgi:Leu/Phe-tRNA-protein transferase